MHPHTEIAQPYGYAAYHVFDEARNSTSLRGCCIEVNEGADILGCSNDTFVDNPTDSGVSKEFTCAWSTSTGTSTAQFFPNSGPWKIVDATEDFSELSRWGAFAVIPDETGPENAGAEMFIGEIQPGR